MPRIPCRNSLVTTMRGLHLFHAGWSNCSMRVRMTLEEKGLPWTSHHLDTRKGEHITADFFSINPNGLVPVLVHDGQVWIESADIIEYLDETFDNPPLQPDDEDARQRMSAWLQLASELHVAGVKTYIYCSRPRRQSRESAAQLALYRSLQTNRTLLEFHTRNAADGGLGETACRSAERLLRTAFGDLDRRLAAHTWLAGDEFSLADIAWLPLHFTLQRAGFDAGAYTGVNRWAEAIAARPSFAKAVLDWYQGPPGGDP